MPYVAAGGAVYLAVHTVARWQGATPAVALVLGVAACVCAALAVWLW